MALEGPLEIRAAGRLSHFRQSHEQARFGIIQIFQLFHE
jgi:hypothetical protein